MPTTRPTEPNTLSVITAFEKRGFALTDIGGRKLTFLNGETGRLRFVYVGERPRKAPNAPGYRWA